MLTTYARGNHALRSHRYRYIRYDDGSEELYDMRKDPNEWTNLVGREKYANVVAEHRKWLPKTSAKPAPGSRSRILVYENGKANWEGEDIGADDPIPEQ